MTNRAELPIGMDATAAGLKAHGAPANGAPGSPTGWTRVTQWLLRERTLYVLFAVCIVVYILGLAVINRAVTKGHVIGSDGLLYYEYLPSVFIDGDLDFKNQRELLVREEVPYDWGPQVPSPITGRVGTPFSIGWALLVSPFFLLAHLLVKLLSPFFGMRSDGYGILYEGLTNLGAVLYGCAGVLYVQRMLRRELSEASSTLTSIGVLGATNLIYYIVAQPSMSHTVGFFATAGALYTCLELARGSRSLRDALLFGMFAGFSTLVRPQLALCVLCMFLFLAYKKTGPKHLAAAGLVAAALGSLQLLTWYTLYGSFLTIPQGQGFLHLSDPALLPTLTSLRHGLLVWHPFYFICLVGLCFGRGLTGTRVLCLVCLATQLYMNAAAADWWAGNAFGLRRFIDALPFFAFGAGLLFERVRSSTAAVIAVSALMLWNVIFIVQYRFGFIPRGETITWRQLVVDKLVLPTVERRY